MPKIHHDNETQTEELQYKLVEHVAPAHEPIAVLNLSGEFFTVGIYKGDTKDSVYIRQDVSECIYLSDDDVKLLLSSLIAAQNKADGHE